MSRKQEADPVTPRLDLGGGPDPNEVHTFTELRALAHAILALPGRPSARYLALGVLSLLDDGHASPAGPTVHGDTVHVGSELTGFRSAEEARRFGVDVLTARDAALRNTRDR